MWLLAARPAGLYICFSLISISLINCLICMHKTKKQIADCLSAQNLRYTYEEVALPWDTTSSSLRKKIAAATTTTTTTTTESVSEFGSDPVTLDTTIRVLVTRSQTSRSKTDKEGAVEVLIISGIQAPLFRPSKFDVYVTTPSGEGTVSSDLGELAGSFVKLPHHGASKDDTATASKDTKLKLGITNLLEDLDAEASEQLVVSLVPRIGDITVGGVSIELLSTGST